jgi:pSer/pThr/pTyr-binding forkhead associated (FHA) protein
MPNTSSDMKTICYINLFLRVFNSVMANPGKCVGWDYSMAILVVVRGSSVGHRYFIEASGLLIGRQFDAEVYLDSLAVSRYHARLLNQSETTYIEDLQSSNGTFVTGHRINGKVRLLDGDLIEIGPYGVPYNSLTISSMKHNK